MYKRQLKHDKCSLENIHYIINQLEASHSAVAQTCDCKRYRLWITHSGTGNEAKHGIEFGTQHAMLPEFGGKCGTGVS